MATAQAIDVSTHHSLGFTNTDEKDHAATSLSRSRPNVGLLADLNQNGCFESDRVIKSGYVHKRTKTKVRHVVSTARQIFGIDLHSELEDDISRSAAANALDVQE